MSELSLVGNCRVRKRKKKLELRRKFKVSTLDIQIERSGLKVKGLDISKGCEEFVKRD